MQPIAIILISLFSFIAGVVCLLGYMIRRMMSNRGWDKSNATNALRLLSHVVLHPTDFFHLYYLTAEQVTKVLHDNPSWGLKQPFWYVKLDELAEVVKSRPVDPED